MGSPAAIDPPPMKSGETQAIRPSVSDMTAVCSRSETVPVSRTVRAWSVAAGRTTATVGGSLIAAADSTAGSPKLGARAK